MTTPNLFDYATSELSQDAFVCWLAAWADPGCRAANGPLHATGTAFITRLLEVGRGPKVSEVRSVEVRRQWQDIAVLLVVNGDTALIVEGKTDTKDHSDQLRRYREAIAKEFPADRIAAVYLQLRDQGHYRAVLHAGYGVFGRKDFLSVLDLGIHAAVSHDIFGDFSRYVRDLESSVQSFRTVPLTEWDRDPNRWIGFFLALQDQLHEGAWGGPTDYTDGRMQFTWHERDEHFLRLEGDRLYFVLTVPDTLAQAKQWRKWAEALTTESEAFGVKIEVPPRRLWTFMKVAMLDGDYRRQGDTGLVDLDATIEVLRQAGALFDAALVRVRDQE